MSPDTTPQLARVPRLFDAPAIAQIRPIIRLNSEAYDGAWIVLTGRIVSQHSDDLPILAQRQHVRRQVRSPPPEPHLRTPSLAVFFALLSQEVLRRCIHCGAVSGAFRVVAAHIRPKVLCGASLSCRQRVNAGA